MAEKPLKLTAKQEKFAQLVAKGSTQSDAYREAYDSEDMLDKSIWEKASELAAIVKVKSRIEELKLEYQLHLKYDAEAHYRELEQLKELALTPMGKDGDIDLKSAIKASELKGKLCGLYVDKQQITGNLTIDDWVKEAVK
jgi:phage terminase small subunit